jgi:hypothetical protein
MGNPLADDFSTLKTENPWECPYKIPVLKHIGPIQDKCLPGLGKQWNLLSVKISDPDGIPTSVVLIQQLAEITAESTINTHDLFSLSRRSVCVNPPNLMI